MTYTEDKELKLYKFFADFFLPAGMLDYFELERMVESSPSRETIAKGAEYSSILDIYLKELDNRDGSQQDLQMNSYTEYTTIEGFPIRDRKVRLHIRRRRWLDKDGKSIIISAYRIKEDGSRYSPEFAAFLKEAHGLDTSHGEKLGENVLR